VGSNKWYIYNTVEVRSNYGQNMVEIRW